MKKKKKYRGLALAAAGVTLVSAVPFQAIAQEEQPKTSSFDVNSADIRMAVGETQTLKAVADFLEEQAGTTDYKIEWIVEEDGKKIVGVDNRGKVTAKAAGTAKVTALIKGKTNLKATVTIQVYSTVEDLKVKQKVIDIKVGEEFPIEYQVLPAKAVEDDVRFKSEDSGIAKVDGKGKVTGVEAGTTKILVSTVDAGEQPFTDPIIEEITVNVTSTVKGVAITNVPNKKLELKDPESTFQLEWTVSPSNAYLKDVTFKSSDTKAVTVSSSGLIKPGKEGGTSTIQVITKDGKYTDEITVTAPLTSTDVPFDRLNVEGDLILNGLPCLALFVGEVRRIDITASPKEAKVPPRSQLTFEVENREIAKVTPGGEIQALKTGQTKVKVIYNDEVYAEFFVDVKSTVTGIRGPKEWTLRVGEVAEPPVDVLPVESAKNKNMYVSFEDSELIKIKSKTEMEGMKPGVTNTIFVTEDGGYTHEMEITVVSTVTSFDIPFETVKIGTEPYQINPEFNKDAYLKTINYEIADDSIISINAKTNTITPKKEGKTTVRAITVDGELVDTFEVVVDYEAKQISIYDENDKLITTSDPTKNPGGGSTNNNELRRMILEKLLEKADNGIIREVIKRLINKL